MAACDLFCSGEMDDFLASGNDLDTVVEIETGPGVFENSTIGQAMCTRSLQLHPNAERYDGKFH